MQLIFGEVVDLRLRRTINAFDIQTPRFSAFRAVLALAQLSVLAFTPYDALMQTLVGRGSGPICDGLRSASTFCIGRNLPHQVVAGAMMLILVGVVIGVFPTIMAVFHAWVAFSIATSISLPDGGDQAAAVCTILLIAVSVADRRTYAVGSQRSVASWRRQVALAGLMVLRVQIATIYFNAAIAKLFAPDWMNGTAVYYVLRDPFFGASGPLGTALRAATTEPAVTTGGTWGVVLTEIVIGVFILCGPRSRSVAFMLCAVLHGAIVITMGLWSFGLIMIAVVGIAAMPYTQRERLQQLWPHSRRRAPILERHAGHGASAR